MVTTEEDLNLTNKVQNIFIKMELNIVIMVLIIEDMMKRGLIVVA